MELIEKIDKVTDKYLDFFDSHFWGLLIMFWSTVLAVVWLIHLLK